MVAPCHALVRSLVLTVVCLVAAAPRADAEPASREAFAFAVELVKGSDPDMRAVALERLRDGLAGEAYSVELAEKVLPAVPPEVQVRLISTLAGRRDAAALPGLVSMAASGDESVAAAAVRAIAALGSGAHVPLLVARLERTGPVRDAARAGLVAIQAADVSPRLVAAAGDATTPAAGRAAIFEILAERRDRAALPLLVSTAKADDPELRAAAMRALARLGGPTEVPGMVAGFLAAQVGAERDDAVRAIVAVCGAGPEVKPAAAEILTAYRAADPATQQTLLPLVARVGGPEALAIVDALVADADPARRTLGLTALSRWPDATVKDRLLGLLAKTSDDGERRLLVGTLIRIAPIPNNGLSDAQRLALLADTMKLCTTDDDRRRILERAGAIRTVETLRFIVPSLDTPPLAESAAKGVVELAHQQKLRDANKPEFTAALDRVLAVAKDPVTRERAERYLQGKTWERR
jgi:HEAT repeat protein